jgi:starch synthase
VPLEQRPGDPSGEPVEPEAFAHAFAERINGLLAEPERAAALGRAGRRRVVEHFGWDAIAARVAELYRRVVSSPSG